MTAIEYRHIRKEYNGAAIIPDFNLKVEKGEFAPALPCKMKSGASTAKQRLPFSL